MQEKVCIVLNEREPHKAKAAETLIAHLKELGITASRQNVDQNIVKNLLQKKPRVVILDYLLGDYSTGLDLLAAFKKQGQGEVPNVFFLTDEPSVQVAVSAMRHGATNYYELDHPRALVELSREVEETLRNFRNSVRSPLKPHPDLDGLVAQASNSRTLISNAKALVEADAGIILIFGPDGSGRHTLAEAMHKSRSCNSLLRHESLKTFDLALNTFADLQKHLGLGHDGSLVLSDIEDDDGSLLTFLSQMKPRLWPEGLGHHHNTYLYLITSDETAFKAWADMLRAEKMRIPPLAQRKEDIAPMVQRFVRDAQEFSGLKVKPLSSEFIHWLCEQSWDGDVRELRACVSHGILRANESDQDLKLLVEEQLALLQAERSNTASQTPEPYVAALALECANHSYRIAAAKLGCSVKTLRESLK